MSGLWDQPGVPHKGWTFLYMEDLEEAFGTCQMCGREQVRYLHHMEHSDYEDTLAVGCVCAAKMEDDYVGLSPAERERLMRNWSSRRERWLSRDWKLSAKGNDFLKQDGYVIVIFKSKYDSTWGYQITREDADIAKGFKLRTEREAKLAAFEAYRAHFLMRVHRLSLR